MNSVFHLRINGEAVEVLAPVHKTLLEVLREELQVLGAVASSPLLASEAAAVLVGQRLTPEVIDTAAQAAFRPAKPLDNTDLTLAYRKKMARVHVTRVLRQLVGLPVVPHR